MSKRPFFSNKAQTAMEYLILLAVVVAIVLIAFQTQMPRVQSGSNIYFNKAASGILGRGNPCGDGTCGSYENSESCCADCGGCRDGDGNPF